MQVTLITAESVNPDDTGIRSSQAAKRVPRTDCHLDVMCIEQHRQGVFRGLPIRRTRLHVLACHPEDITLSSQATISDRLPERREMTRVSHRSASNGLYIWEAIAEGNSSPSSAMAYQICA